MAVEKSSSPQTYNLLSRTEVVVVCLGAILVGVVTSLTLPIFLASAKVEYYLDLLSQSRYLYLAIPFAIIAAVALVRFPLVNVYLLGLLLPFGFIGGELNNPTLNLIGKIAVDGLFAVSIVCALLAPWSQKVWLVRTRVGLALAAFLGVLAFAALLGLVAKNDLSNFLREANWLGFYLFAGVAGTLIQTRRHVAILLGFMLVGVVILQMFAFNSFVYGIRYERADGWAEGTTFIRVAFSSPQMFFLYFACAGLLILWWQVDFRRMFKLGLLALALLLGAGLLASMGRTVWLSAAVGLAVLLFFIPWDGQRIRVLGLLGITLVGGTGLVAVLDSLSHASSGNWLGNVLNFVLFLGEDRGASVAGRVEEWQNAIQVWVESPLAGKGLGAAFPRTLFNPEDLAAFYLHNSYLNLLAKLGLVGIAAFAAVLFFVLQVGVRGLVRKDLNPWDRTFLTAAVATLVQMMIMSIFAPVISTTDSVMFFALLIGIVAVWNRLATSDL